MSEFTVHSIPGSPFGRAVLATLEEKGASYRILPAAPGTLRSREHLARHPFGRVPVLEHNGFSLYETQAILRYLDRVLPTPALTPADPKRTARMDQVMNVNDWYLFQGVGNVIGFHRVVGPRVMGLTPAKGARCVRRTGAAFGRATLFRRRSHIARGPPGRAADRLLHPNAGMVGARRAASKPRRLAGTDGSPSKHEGDDVGARVGNGQGGVN